MIMYSVKLTEFYKGNFIFSSLTHKVFQVGLEWRVKPIFYLPRELVILTLEAPVLSQ